MCVCVCVCGQGYTLKAGRSIYANIILTQRDPNHFTDPETFDPERFSLDRAEDQKAKFAWVPLIWPQPARPQSLLWR